MKVKRKTFLPQAMEPSSSMQHQVCCSVQGCQNLDPKDRLEGVFFFKIVDRPYSQQQKWLEILGRDKEWIPSKDDVICSNHFVNGICGSVSQEPGYLPKLCLDQPELGKHLNSISLKDLNGNSCEEKVNEESNAGIASKRKETRAVTNSKKETSLSRKRPVRSCAGNDCVISICRNNQTRDKHRLKFYRFAALRPGKLAFWLNAMDKHNPDGSKWKPTQHDVICSAHFKKSDNEADVEGAKTDITPNLNLKWEWMTMASTTETSSKNKGKYCCAPRCHNNEGTHRPKGIQFYRCVTMIYHDLFFCHFLIGNNKN